MNLIKIDRMLSCKFANMAFVCTCLVVQIHVLVRPVRGSALWWISGIGGADGIAIGIRRLAPNMWKLMLGGRE